MYVSLDLRFLIDLDFDFDFDFWCNKVWFILVFYFLFIYYFKVICFIDDVFFFVWVGYLYDGW